MRRCPGRLVARAAQAGGSPAHRGRIARYCLCGSRARFRSAGGLRRDGILGRVDVRLCRPHGAQPLHHHLRLSRGQCGSRLRRDLSRHGWPAHRGAEAPCRSARGFGERHRRTPERRTRAGPGPPQRGTPHACPGDRAVGGVFAGEPCRRRGPPAQPLPCPRDAAVGCGCPASGAARALDRRVA